MFNRMHRDFDEDPFFADPLRAHREHMRQMMRSFSEPFGGPLTPSLTDGRNHGERDQGEHPSSSNALSNEHRDMSRSLFPYDRGDTMNATRNPFSMFDHMMSNMGNMRLDEMHRNLDNATSDPSSHSFSSSSFVTYSKVGNEPPKVFQATSTTRRAPGGIKETRQAVKDSESGLEKMRIGHHIQERGHVVEKKINKKTGEKEFNQDFQNMDEGEAQSFDNEWQQKVSKFQSSSPMSCLKEPQPRAARKAGPQVTYADQEKNCNAEGKRKQVKGLDTTRQHKPL